MKKSILSFLLTLCLMLTMIPTTVMAYNETELTSTTVIEAGSTYTISDMVALKAFKSLVEAGNTFEGSTVKLMANIQMGDGTRWIAIGSSQGSNASINNAKAFKGTFDGQGYTLKNATFPYENINTYGIGLFAKLDGATIKNVKMSGIKYAVTNTSYYSYYYIGSIAGYISNSTINNCSVAGTMGPGKKNSGSSTPSMRMVGGIVGYANADSIIQNCTNSLNIDLYTGIYNNKNSGVGYPIGGIVGQAVRTRILNCVNNGRVAGDGGDSYGSAGVGGIVGYVADSTTIDGCFNSGETVAYSASSTSVYDGPTGGIVGTTQGENINIANCWNDGYVAPYGECGGGIVGRSGSTTTNAEKEIYSGAKYPVTVFNCLNTGKIWTNDAGQGRYEITASSSSRDGCGGIVGYVGHTNGIYVENCYNQGVVIEGSTYSSARFSAGVIGNTTTGGFAFAYINHSYLLDQNDGLATQRWLSTQSNSAGVNVNNSIKNFLGLMQDDALNICSDLNSYAATKTTWGIEKNTYRITNVFINSDSSPRDYTVWTYDLNGIINDGLPYLNILTNGYNQTIAEEGRGSGNDIFSITYTDGSESEEIFTDQVISNLVSDTATPPFNGTISRDGYEFAGWIPEIAARVTSDVTYEATWTEIPEGNNEISNDEENSSGIHMNDGQGKEIFQN